MIEIPMCKNCPRNCHLKIAFLGIIKGANGKKEFIWRTVDLNTGFRGCDLTIDQYREPTINDLLEI